MSEPVEVRKERVVAAPGVAASRSTVLPYGYKARQFVWLSVAVVDLFLALRFALLAAGAGDSGFTTIVNTVGAALAWPFQGVFGVTSASGHPLQWVNILAIVVYTVAAWIVAKLVSIASVPSDRSAPVY
jgi:hypothetical protein